MTRTRRECSLCSQIDGWRDNDLIARLLPAQPYVRRVMMESPSFALLPSLGPLVPGHSLLCPKDHLRSYAQLGANRFEEFSTIKNAVIDGLSHQYGRGVHLFEHGMAATGDRVLCTVDHAHLHFLPLGPMTAIGDGWSVFDGSMTSLRRMAEQSEYVMYESPERVSHVFVSQNHEIESQYMRKLIAKGLGRADDWNWRTSPDPHAADLAWRSFVASGVC